jgi:hypothetical protein
MSSCHIIILSSAVHDIGEATGYLSILCHLRLKTLEFYSLRLPICGHILQILEFSDLLKAHEGPWGHQTNNS